MEAPGTPAGGIKEISMDNGWAREFIEISAVIDKILADK